MRIDLDSIWQKAKYFEGAFCFIDGLSLDIELCRVYKRYPVQKLTSMGYDQAIAMRIYTKFDRGYKKINKQPNNILDSSLESTWSYLQGISRYTRVIYAFHLKSNSVYNCFCFFFFYWLQGISYLVFSLFGLCVEINKLPTHKS